MVEDLDPDKRGSVSPDYSADKSPQDSKDDSAKDNEPKGDEGPKDSGSAKDGPQTTTRDPGDYSMRGWDHGGGIHEGGSAPSSTDPLNQQAAAPSPFLLDRYLPTLGGRNGLGLDQILSLNQDHLKDDIRGATAIRFRSSAGATLRTFDPSRDSLEPIHNPDREIIDDLLKASFETFVLDKPMDMVNDAIAVWMGFKDPVSKEII
jgi:hypothetical protein